MKEKKDKNHGKGTILIVEDEGVISLDIRNLLIELGYKVAGVALSGKEALAMAKKSKPDLVLMDIVLKGPMDGITAAAKIKLLHGIPSIFLTSYVDEERVERAKLVQPFGYILKPFRNEELRAAIEMALFRLSTEKTMGKRDVERTRLERVLAGSEAKFRLVFQEAIDGILIADIKTKRFVMANSALCKLLGYREKEILKLGIHDIHPKKDLPQVLDQFMDLTIGKTKVAEAVPCLRKDGSVVYVDIAASVLRLNNRHCLVGFFRDITEKIEAQKTILESEKQFRSLAERSQDAIFSTDAHGIITYMSPAFEKMSGFRPTDALGKRFDHFLEHSEKKRANTIFEVTTKTHGANHNLQFKILKKDGGFFWGEVSGHPIVEGKVLVGTEGSVHDITEQKRIGEEILRLKEFNERIVKDSPVGIVTTDIDGNITSANPAIVSLLGSPSEQKTSRFNVLTFEPLVRQGISTFFKNCLRRGKTVQAYGVPYQSFWGKSSFINMKLVPLSDESGVQIGSIALIEDVTERKRDEKVISEGEERFKAAFRNAPVGMALVNPNERFLLVNPQFCSMLGYSEKELRSFKYTDLIHPEEVVVSKKRIQKMVKGYTHVVGAEKRFLHKNGSIVWAIVNAYSVRGEQRRDDYAVVHVLDISDRKRAENELLLKNALLDAQKEASTEGILAVDANGKIISHNARFEEMWRIPDDVVKIGDDQRLIKFVLSQLKDPEAFLSLVKKLYSNSEKRSQDLIEFTDGRVFSRYTSPLNDSKGNHLGRIWFFRDITHEIEIDRAKSEFISNASHELRTPLNGVKWLLEAVLRRGHLTTPQAEFIRKALESNARIIELANDLLDVTMLEAGTITPMPSKTNLNHLLARLIEDFKPFVNAKQQTIRLTVSDKHSDSFLDAKLFSQAFSNVLINAIKYSGPNKTIDVALRKHGQGFKIHVNDQGEGMGKAEQQRIFERFFRGKAAIHRSIQGVGLGLYLAKKFITLCGGSIEFVSKLGKGTHVTLSIPSKSSARPSKLPNPKE